MLSERERNVLLYISGRGLNISKRPFLEAARALGMSEEGVIEILRRLQEEGVIKSLRGVINHTQAGYRENALIAWRMNPAPLEKHFLMGPVRNNPSSETKRKISKEAKPQAQGSIRDAFIENDLISHCYERKPHKEFNYNIFTMMHAKKRREIESFASRIGKDFNADYVLLFTEEEVKKEKLDLKELLCSKS